MKQPAKSDRSGENPSATIITRSTHEDEQGTAASTADNPGLAATAHMNKHKSPDKEDLARSLEALQTQPRKISRSYLVPYTEHLLLLLGQGYSYRDMLRWLYQEHGVQSYLGTLQPFLKRAKRELRRARHSHVVVESSPSNIPGAAAKVVSPTPAYKPSGNGSKTRRAILAAKEKAALPEPNNDKSVFHFDASKPLLNNSKPSSNPKTKPN